MSVTRHAALAVVVAGCWGCWTEPPVPQAPADPAPAQAAPRDEAPRRHRSVWEGHYKCAQGQTALRLTIDREAADRAVAVLEFGPLAENPGVPRGSYRLVGSITDTDTGELEVTLRPAEWLDQPLNYMMVGLVATTTHDRRLMHGKLAHPTCGDLEARRLD